MENNTMIPKSGPKDVFYHLLAIVSLYMSAVSFITLMFSLVNQWFPDPLSPDYYSSDAIRWSASVLIVAFPVYLYMNWLINKDSTVDPAKREIRVRKWLGYLTLFISAITVIVDVIALVFNFLGGEVSMRFFSKIIVVLVVAGLIFWYYLKDMKHIPETPAPTV